LLPSSLLITRRRRDKIRPVYAKLNKENLGIARLLIQTYRDYVGKTKGELNGAANGLENMGYDYRYVRGLSTLLDRRCQLEPKAILNPIKVRRQIFKMSHKEGFPTTLEARRAVLNQVAKKLEITLEELEESLYGDLEDELLLKYFNPVDPKDLVKQYNLSLTQTLLFYSTELSFTTIGNWQRIFRQIKWLGLIYTVRRSHDRYEVKVDGPVSLFKLNRRYGTSLARLLPTILKNQEWRVEAKILRYKGDRRLLNLELDNTNHGGIMKAFGTPNGKETYDSQVEQDFAVRFRALDTGWKLIREPEPIPVGKRVMIPDFGFRKGGMTVYLEVAGFWTPQYLEEKTKKLGQVDDVDMIVAANKELACQKLDKIGETLKIIYYKRRIPIKPILLYLKAREKLLVIEQTKHLKNEALHIQKPIVDARELAERLGVLEDAVKETLMEREFPGYTRLGDMLIKKTKLEEIQKKIENRLHKGELNLVEASRIVKGEGGRRTANILDALSYNIEWHGINPHSTKIRKKTKT
jgi:predicted nuclease of restriction endonuclease-like RecB superfamily